MDTATSAQSLTDQAITYCSLYRFHQNLNLPATSEHGELRVTYSLVGLGVNDDGTVAESAERVPLLLWCQAMFGGRWQGLALHNIALKMGVRVCFVDRPGMGGSTRMNDLSKRVSVWLETVPALLKKLGVEHVTLVSHSAGTIYLLNTMFYLRHILDPKRPYVAMLAPWVDPKYSKVTAMQLAGKMPVDILNKWDKVMGFISSTIMPALSSSADVLAFSGSLTSRFFTPSVESQEKKKKIEEAYGMSQELFAEVQRLAIKYLFAEDITVVNEEAKLCLKAEGLGKWGVCEDYTDYVVKLVEQERELKSKREEIGNLDTGVESGKLKINVFFGETDAMIGEKGREYFQSCWTEERCDGLVDFESVITKGSNHETVWDPWRGPIEKIFSEAKGNMGTE